MGYKMSCLQREADLGQEALLQPSCFGAGCLRGQGCALEGQVLRLHRKHGFRWVTCPPWASVTSLWLGGPIILAGVS